MVGTQRHKKDNAILGAAGEHFVMSKLLLLDLVACMAPAGAANIDIVISDSNGNSQCAVQVKSHRRKNSVEPRSWPMDAKNEVHKSPKLFYCFVSFSDFGVAPISYIVPSGVVATYLEDNHKWWMATPGKQGQDHKDNSIRKFDLGPREFERGGRHYCSGWAEQYKESWNLISECVASE